MSKQTPFFKFDSASWLSGTIQFTSLDCKGLFIDICALYWESQKPVKTDTKFKVRVRCDQGTLTDLLDTLEGLEIIQQSEAGITVPFLDDLMSERQEFIEKCSKAGKKSASIQGSSTNKKEERRKKKEECREKNEEIKDNSGYTAEFENFWKEYERKGSKANAYKRWKRLSANDRSDAVKAIPHYFIENPDAQYRKDAEGYLNGKLFESVIDRMDSGQNQSGGECAGQSVTISREQFISYFGSEEAAIAAGKIKPLEINQ